MCYYKLAANAETFQSCPETLTLLSECCRSHGAEDLAPGQMSSIFSHSFRRCRVSLEFLWEGRYHLKGGWHVLALYTPTSNREKTPDRKVASQVTLLSPDMGSVPQISDCWCNYTPHTARLTSGQLEATLRRPAFKKSRRMGRALSISPLESMSLIWIQVRVNDSLTHSSLYVKYIVDSKRQRALVNMLLIRIFKSKANFHYK